MDNVFSGQVRAGGGTVPISSSSYLPFSFLAPVKNVFLRVCVCTCLLVAGASCEKALFHNVCEEMLVAAKFLTGC